MKLSPASIVAPLALGAFAWPVDAQEPPPEPAPEPAPMRGLRAHEKGAFDGYTLIAPLRDERVYLLDMQGEIVHSWKTEGAPGGGFYLLPNGNLLRCGRVEADTVFRGGGIGGLIQELDWEGEVVWEYRLAGADRTQHHDLAPMPNGNVLAIVWEHVFREDALAAGRDAHTLDEDGLWPDAVVEIRPERPAGGEIVWEWRAFDHVIQDRDPEKRAYGSIPDHPERIDVNADHRGDVALTPKERRRREELERQMRATGYVGGDDDDDDDDDPRDRRRRRGRGADWLHTNSIDYHPGLDLIVLSTPRMNEIWVIDHSTTTEEAAGDSGGRWGRGGGLLYRWGNPRSYGLGERGDQRLFAQHDATWLGVDEPGRRPRILLFNNGSGRPGEEYSSVEELELPFDPEKGFLREPGRPFGPARPRWTYTDRKIFYSAFISGAQRLPNGNTLICQGAQGRVFEITREGRTVWDFWNPYDGEVPQGRGGDAPRNALFRATRIGRDHPGLDGREL